MYAIQPSEAWQLTPSEYWSLYDFKVASNPKNDDLPLTRAEFDALREELEASGKA